MIQRWRHNIEVRDDDTDYADTLNTLSDGSVRRSFNPYTDIDWDSPDCWRHRERSPLDSPGIRPAAPPPV